MRCGTMTGIFVVMSLVMLWLAPAGCVEGQRVTRGSFTKTREVLQTARCQLTTSGDTQQASTLAAIRSIDSRRAAFPNRYLARVSNITPTAILQDVADMRQCVTRGDIMTSFLEVTCLTSKFFDLTREGLLCEFANGSQIESQPPAITSQTVAALDCRQEYNQSGNSDVNANINVVIEFVNTKSGNKLSLQSKDLHNTTLLPCDVTGTGPAVLCRADVRGMVVIADDVEQGEPPQCSILGGQEVLWSGRAVTLPDCPPAAVETSSTTAWAVCGVLIFLLIVFIAISVIVVCVKRLRRQDGGVNKDGNVTEPWSLDDD